MLCGQSEYGNEELSHNTQLMVNFPRGLAAKCHEVGQFGAPVTSTNAQRWHAALAGTSSRRRVLVRIVSFRVGMCMRSGFVRHRRVVVAGLCVPALAASLLAAAAHAPALPPHLLAPAAPIEDQVEAANASLAAAKADLAKAQSTLDDAATQLPQAQARVQQALTEVAQAQAAEARARAAVAAAQQAVTVARKKIDKTQGHIDALKARIQTLAREVYTSGGEYQEIEILLESRDPSDFALQLNAVRRQSRSNSTTLDEIGRLKAELDARLIELAALERAAKESQDDADANAARAQDSSVQAASAQQQVERLIAAREGAVAEANANRAKLRTIYLGLLAEQRRLAEEAARKKEINSAAWTGQEGAAAHAVKFALSQVGHRYNTNGGTGPTYGCNGFTWRAWREAGSKWPLLMAQDQSTSSYTQRVSVANAKPGDVIFWRMNNGTDWRENAIDHVGLVVDPASGKFVHAANSRDGVKVSNYKTESAYRNVAAVVRVLR